MPNVLHKDLAGAELHPPGPHTHPDTNLSSLDVIATEELARAFREASTFTERALKKAIVNTACRVEGQAKQNAPIDEGILQGSINTDGPREGGNDVIATTTPCRSRNLGDTRIASCLSMPSGAG